MGAQGRFCSRCIALPNSTSALFFAVHIGDRFKLVGIEALEARLHPGIPRFQLFENVLEETGNILEAFIQEPVSITVRKLPLDTQVAGSVGAVTYCRCHIMFTCR